MQEDYVPGKIELFWGDDLLKKDKDIIPLIDYFLYDRDVIMLLGSEKAGKSIAALQMACCLSSGANFLGKYPCKKVAVAYLQLEGKRDETAVRLENMMKTIPADPLFFFRLYKKFLPLDVVEYKNMLRRLLLDLPMIPRVIFIDCLYMCMEGDLIDNKDIRKFLSALSEILEEFRMTCVLIHHEKRETIFEGETVNMGDKGSYGSVFLRAFVDHIVYLKMNKDKSRVISCDTQRSGKIAGSEELLLVQPTPLFFKIKGRFTPAEEAIQHLLDFERLTKDEICVRLELSASCVEKAVRFLISEGIINVVDQRKLESGQFANVYGTIKNDPQ